MTFFDKNGLETDINFKDQDKSKQKIVMLVPEGVTAPKRFQNMFEMNAIYTSSAKDFYFAPNNL